MLSDNPLVSVIMPVYNCVNYVAEAIESVIGQTYTNWELLICDDNSTDNSLDIIKQYALREKRIKYFHNKSNCGGAQTKNMLIRNSHGEFIAMMDADDVCDKNRFADQLDFIHKKLLDGCGTNFYTVDEVGNFIDGHKNHSSYQQILWSAFNNFSFCNASLLVKRECISKINGYNEDLKTEAEDIDMIFRLLARKYRIETIASFHYGYRQHGKNVSARLRHQQKLNSYTATHALFEKILEKECPNDFVHFMKYYHRADFKINGNCLGLFKNLVDLKDGIEKKILHHRMNDPAVKMDIAKKMFFLALNHRHTSRSRSVVLGMRALLFYPAVLAIMVKDKWKQIA